MIAFAERPNLLISRHTLDVVRIEAALRGCSSQIIWSG